MPITLHIIFEGGFCEYPLPDILNGTIEKEIPPATSGFSHKISLSLEIWDGIWKIVKNDTVLFDSQSVTLEDGMRIPCSEWESGKKFQILVVEDTPSYSSFQKYNFPADRRLTIGRDTDNNISLNIQGFISVRHAIIQQTEDGCMVIDASTNGIFVNGQRVNTSQALKFGDVVGLFGLKIAYLGECIAINKPVEEMAIRGLTIYTNVNRDVMSDAPADTFYKRSPRLVLKLDNEAIDVEAPIVRQDARETPSLTAIAPLFITTILMMVSLILLLWRGSGETIIKNSLMTIDFAIFLTAMIGSVFWALLSFFRPRKAEKIRKENQYSTYLKYIRRILNEKRTHNKDVLEKMYPKTDDVLSFAETGAHRLWERSVNHFDFLSVRLGTGDIPSPNSVKVAKEWFLFPDELLVNEAHDIRSEYTYLKDVPICLNLSENRIAGIIGQGRSCVEVVHIIAAQIAACCSYTDVRMVFIYNKEQEQDFEFARWLPHTRNDDHTLRMVANDKNSVRDVLRYLEKMLHIRTEEKEKTRALPHYVIFVTDPAMLEDEPMATTLYAPTEHMGLSVVLAFGEIGYLPNTCSAIIRKDEDYNGYYSLNDELKGCKHMSFDRVSVESLERFAKTLSGCHLHEIKQSRPMPVYLSFLEMYHAAKIEEFDVYHNWMVNFVYESMKAIVGYKNTNAPFYLDIHEKAHGPHGLIAGATGSGKSELLITYILSLAINYHPHDLAFVIIDYKGGETAFKLTKLPHVANVITDLSGNQMYRALSAIKGELKRRKMLFNEHRVDHIDEYIRLYRAEKIDAPIPHLIIILDEFAELKMEFPDCVQELLSLIRTGRSLGIHMIWATQKPSGVVNEQLYSNTRFKLCLRVNDEADSNEMLGRPDAAYITNPGRGFYQVGKNEVFEQFQTGWSGAPYNPESTAGNMRIINLQGKTVSNESQRNKLFMNSQSQMETIVKHITDTAHKKSVLPAMSILLPQLPDRIFLDDLKRDTIEGKASCLTAIVGLVDDPARQQQYPLALDFTDMGHMLITGSAGGGKTSFLQTLLYSLLSAYTPDQVNVYISDSGNRSFEAFEILPHVGGIAYDLESDKVNKTIKLLMGETARRKLRFAEAGIVKFSDYVKIYNDLPAVLFVIDNYDAFSDNFSENDDDIAWLSREAAIFGIYLIISCTGINEVRVRIRQYLKFGVGLQIKDRFEHGDILGVRASFEVNADIPGRGLVSVNGSALEFQTALCFDVSNVIAMNNSMKKRFEDIKNNWHGANAPKIPQIPDDMTVRNIMAISDVAEKIAGNRFLPLGYDFKEAEPLYVDLNRTFCFTISGAPKTGKTELLKALMYAAKSQDCICYVFGGASMKLKSFASELGISYMSTADEYFDFMQETLIPEFQQRNAKKAEAISDGTIDTDSYLDSQPKICLFIEDIDEFCNITSEPNNKMSGFVEMMLTRGDRHLVCLFACVSTGNTFRKLRTEPIIQKFVVWKEGVHLGGAVASQTIFDFELRYSDLSKRLPEGHGYIEDNGVTKRIVTIHT